VQGVQAWAAARGILREFFLLENAGRRSAATAARDRESILAYYDAGQRRRAVANTLSIPSDTPAGLILYREACLCLIRAALLATSRVGEERPNVEAMKPEAAWEAVGRVVGDWASVSPADLASVREVLVAEDPLALDRLSIDKARGLSAAFRDVMTRLCRLIEPRSALQIQRARGRRQAFAALAVLVLIAIPILRRRNAPNLALHRPVQSSPVGFDTTPGGAVDGVTTGGFGFHTQRVESPQVTIDLEKVHDIGEVKVIGRGDCCWCSRSRRTAPRIDSSPSA